MRHNYSGPTHFQQQWIQNEYGQLSCPPKEKKDQHLHYGRDHVALGPLHRQSRVTYQNLAGEDFRDFAAWVKRSFMTDRDEATDPPGWSSRTQV